MFTIAFFALLAIAAVVAGFFFAQRTLGIAVGVVVFVAGFLFSSFTIISAGHTGVQVTFGEVNQIGRAHV